MICLLVLLLMLGGLWVGAVPAAAAHAWFAPSPPLLAAGTGAAGIFDAHQEVYWDLEYRPAFRFCHFGPWFSFGTGRNHEFYAAVGVLAELELGRDWIFVPGFGGGYYNAASGIDLGFDAEFRSSLELARRFRNGQRLGFVFSHISNGSLGDKNPGSETLGLNYAIPFRRLFHRLPVPTNAE